jgi:transposase
VKSLEQQADLCLHRARQGFIEERTATINRLRGLLAEFGHVIAQRAVEVRRQVPPLLEQLPARAARCVADLLEHVRELERKIAAYEREIEAQARNSCPRATGPGASGRRPDYRLGDRRQRRRRHRVLQRAAVRCVVGTGAATVLDRRQDAPRPHHATRRWLSADAARDGRALGVATRLA